MKANTIRVIRYCILAMLLVIVLAVQHIPGWGEIYARSVYPSIASFLTFFSRHIPFSLGDLFIFLSILGIIVYPVYGRIKKVKWKIILLRCIEYLVWVYVWFYIAWGLNYSQDNFYRKTNINYVAYTPQNFKEFIEEYIVNLNSNYVPVETINEDMIRNEVVEQYNAISVPMAIHTPAHDPRVKTMMFTPLFSMMGISGYMGPFFCEFNLNGDLLPTQYPSTYAHELAHLLGITSEAEANFYAYQVCIRSSVPEIKFCGYFSILNHVLANARGLLTTEEYINVVNRIRPEIIALSKANREYWEAKYSPVVGSIQEWIYDLYLKGNKIPSGRKNYSEVVGLLISWREADK